jgi:hypothetical protein
MGLTRAGAFVLGRLVPSCSFIVACVVHSVIVCANAPAQDKLAVINAKGEIWARDLSDRSISGGVKLAGPGLFGGPDDQFVIAYKLGTVGAGHTGKEHGGREK